VHMIHFMKTEEEDQHRQIECCKLKDVLSSTQTIAMREVQKLGTQPPHIIKRFFISIAFNSP